MNKTFKKILTTTLIGVSTAGAIGCATPNSKIAEKINKGVNDFVSSINKLDYVDTNNNNSNLGKIVSAAEEANFFTKVAKSNNIENTITKPTERSDNFKLYVLADSPFISLTSDDNSISLSMQFSTEKIENTSDNINEKINKLILKRAILMVYVNEIYNGNVTLSEENRTAINAYVNVIKENASFLNGNRGMVKNQLGMASDLINNQSNDNIVNYYIIKSGEALEIRSNKIDSTISAIDSITNILEQNLTSSSKYYQNSLTDAYNNMISNMNSSITDENEDKKIAKSIAESINLINSENTNYNDQITTYPLNDKTRQLKNCPNCLSNTTKHNLIPNNSNSTNNNINQNNIMTLEEKTQNSSENSKKQTNIERLDNNFTNLTPAQKAKLRKQRRLNQQNIHQNNIENNNYRNYTENNNKNSNNPTINNNLTVNDNNTKEIQMNNNVNKSPNTIKQNQDNRAIRVPYRVTSNIND